MECGVRAANLGSSLFDHLYSYFAIKTRRELAMGNSDHDLEVTKGKSMEVAAWAK